MVYETMGELGHGRIAIGDGAIRKSDILSQKRGQASSSSSSMSSRCTVEQELMSGSGHAEAESPRAATNVPPPAADASAPVSDNGNYCPRDHSGTSAIPEYGKY